MKLFIIKLPTKNLILFSLAFVIFISTLLTVCTASSKRLLPIYSVDTEDKPYIALTFDCAWEDSDLDEISGILKQNNVKATFYVTGEFATRYKDKIKALYSDGHEIGNHSYSHPHIAKLTETEFEADTIKCNEAIKDAIGEYPKTYRAPYGEYNNTIINSSAELNLKVIQWDCDSLDWKLDCTTESIIKNIEKKIQNGSIMLFHIDSKNKQTALALKILISNLISKGYEFKTISDIIYNEHYTIDNNGKMKKINN